MISGGVNNDEAPVIAEVARIHNRDGLHFFVRVLISELLLAVMERSLVTIDWYRVLVVFTFVGEDKVVRLRIEIKAIAIRPHDRLDDGREWHQA